MSTLFEEINEEMRSQRLRDFWKENGAWIIGGAIFAVLLTGTLSFYNHWQAVRETTQTARLIEAAAQEDIQSLETFAQDARKNHAALARLMAAGRLARAGDRTRAIELYETVASTRGLDDLYKGLAKTLSLSLRLDEDDTSVLEKELAPLTQAKSPWRWSAQEMQALLAARMGDYARAGEILTAIASDDQAPQSLRTRAFTLRDFYLAKVRADELVKE